MRRGAARRRPLARHRRRRAVQPLPHDGRRRRRARPRGAPRAVRRPARRDRPATSCSPSCSAPSCTTSAARRTTGASWRSPASSSPTSSIAAGRRAALDPDRRQHADRRARLPRRLRRARRAVPRGGHRRRRRSCTRRRAAAPTPGSSPGGPCCGRSATTTSRRCWRSASPRASCSACPTSRRWPREALALIGSRRRGASTTTSRSTTAGSATTTACRRRPATRPSAGRPSTAAGCSTATYTGKGFAGLLGNAATGRWRAGDDVVFIHTGGLPAVFAECAGARGRRPVASSQPMSEILDVDLLAFERGSGAAAAGGRRRRAAQPRDRVRVHPPRPVRGPARHGLRDAARVLRGAARGQAALRRARAPTARPATPGCSSRPPRRATCRTGRRCSTGRRRSPPATR